MEAGLTELGRSILRHWPGKPGLRRKVTTTYKDNHFLRLPKIMRFTLSLDVP